jgi:hypothetical protein
MIEATIEALSAYAEDLNTKSLHKDAVSHALEQACTDFGGYGVEVTTDENFWLEYYGSIVAEYVNMGDTYTGTIVFDVHERSFKAMSIGDWIEKFQKEYEENTLLSEQEEQLIEDGYEVIDSERDMVLAVHTETRRAKFMWSTDTDHSAVYDWDQLGQVSSRYDKRFEEMVKKNNYIIETIDTPEEYYDILIKQ